MEDLFERLSIDGWKALVTKELKGADPNQLRWNSPLGFSIDPYLADNTKHPAALTPFSYQRAWPPLDRPWNIACEIELLPGQAEKANKEILRFLNQGATAIILSGCVQNEAEFVKILKDVLPEYIEIYFRSEQAFDWCRYLSHWMISQDKDPRLVKGGIIELTNSDLKESTHLMHMAQVFNSLPAFQCLAVPAFRFYDASADQCQEIAMALCQGKRLIDFFVNQGMSVDEITAYLQFTFSISPLYFVEIAKLRAFRQLWAQLVKAYLPQYECSQVAKMTSMASLRHYTTYDAHNNLLRATTMAMSAAIGGSHTIMLPPYNFFSSSDSIEARRLSINIQLILQNESFLSQVIDPAGGSYYIEELTDQMARKAWSHFQEMEATGGYKECVKNGFFDNIIHENATSLRQNIGARTKSILGVNQFPNPSEQLSVDAMQMSLRSFQKHYHEGEGFESLRLSVDTYVAESGRRPKVVLIGGNDLNMRMARYGFIRNFFSSAGLGIEECKADDVESIDEDANAYILCAADEEYEALLASISQKLPSAQLFVAGNPKSIDPDGRFLKASQCIHIKTNALEFLTDFVSTHVL
jgi:methylmalonyl-CoA mutase